MSDDLLTLARRLDQIVADLPGVSIVFASDPAVIRTAKQLTAGSQTPPLISVAASDSGVDIAASVGVTGTDLAPVTASIIAAAIRAELPEGLEATVSVRISRISD
jgi:hypothetical protein